MRPWVAVAVVLVALCGCGGPDTVVSAPAPDAERTQDLVPLTTAQAARAADRVALVRSLGSRVVEGMPGTPFTRTRFAVDDVLKGRLPREFVVQTIGGQIGDVRVESPVPAFATEHRYVLFLGPDGPAGPSIFPQSVIELRGDDGGAVASVRRALR